MALTVRKDNTIPIDELMYMDDNGQVYSRLDVIMKTKAASLQMEYEKEHSELEERLNEIKERLNL